MDYKKINMFPIREYLAGLNIYPAKERGYYGMYHSPFREDHDASMKVDYNKNLWIDYGANEGGTLIDLVMRIKNISFSEAVTSLSQYNSTTVQQPDSFSFHGNSTSNKETGTESAIRITGITSITSPALLDYLRERKINIEIAKFHCKEITYSVNGKPYFAIGFPNDAGGYELRSKYFKGCTSKAITSYTSKQDTCLVFEGFMDYLSFLTIKDRQRSPIDVFVLNSLTNLSKVKDTLAGYKSVALFLDNDEAGKQAVQNLRPVCKEVLDQSVHYKNHKDLNEYLCNYVAPKQTVKRKPGRGMKM
jgi:DNA primase